MKPSKRMQKLIDGFDDAAQNWGWQSDQGTGSSVDNSKADYDSAKKQLEAAIARLENKVYKLKKNINVAYGHVGGPFPASQEVL